MTGRDHEIRGAAEGIDEVVDSLFTSQPYLAIVLADAVMTLLPDIADRYMSTVWAKRNQTDFF